MKRRTEIQSKFFDIFSCLAIFGGKGKETGKREEGGREKELKCKFTSSFPFLPFSLFPFLLTSSVSSEF
jgi:hypothetical protein